MFIDLLGLIFSIMGLLLPRIILGSRIDEIFLQKRNWLYLFLLHLQQKYVMLLLQESTWRLVELE